jgi:hypothetical protein
MHPKSRVILLVMVALLSVLALTAAAPRLARADVLALALATR